MGTEYLSSRAIIGRLYMRLQQGAAGWVDRLAMRFDSDQYGEDYAWLGMSPQMREWVGGRLAKSLSQFHYQINNKEWEATLAIKLRDLKKDKTGQIMTRVDNLANRANSFYAKLLSQLLVNGSSAVCYDGEYFFDTDHSEGDSGSQSNSIAFDISDAGTGGTPTKPSAASAGQAVFAAVAQMNGFLDDQGEPINEGASEYIVMTPPTLWAPTLTGVASPALAGGETNPLNNLRNQGVRIDVVANPRLTSWTDKIAVLRADKSDGVAPLIIQEAQPLNISALAEGSEHEFKNKEHLYGVDTEGNVGYGFWQHACLVTLQA